MLSVANVIIAITQILNVRVPYHIYQPLRSGRMWQGQILSEV